MMQAIGLPDPLAQAERQAREAGDRVARQRAMIMALQRGGHRCEARLAGKVLAKFESHLRQAQEEVLLERWVHDWLDGVGP